MFFLTFFFFTKFFFFLKYFFLFIIISFFFGFLLAQAERKFLALSTRRSGPAVSFAGGTLQAIPDLFKFLSKTLALSPVVNKVVYKSAACFSLFFGFFFIYIWAFSSYGSVFLNFDYGFLVFLLLAGVLVFYKLFFFFMFSSFFLFFFLFWISMTYFLLSLSAFFNYDLKKILAYSTVSNISFLLFCNIHGVFLNSFCYLQAHAFSKVLLFLLFGYLIDACAGVRDIRKFGVFFKLSGSIL